jgi:glycosyltransferase involved in cell wall biosynthesis
VRLIPVLDFGGVESRFVMLSRLIDRDRYDFRVCTFWKAGAAARAVRDLGIQVDELGVDPAIRNPRASVALLKYLRRVRPDVVHSTIGEANFHNALTAKLAGVKATIIEESGLPNRRLGGRLIHAALYRRVDAVVAVSGTSRHYLSEREYAPASKLRVIHNCARPEFFEPHPRQPRRDGRFTILTAGRLAAVKNHRRFLEALQIVSRKHPEVRFQIAGEGPLVEEVAAWVRELGLEAQVELLGFRADVMELLLRADLFVLPSLSEGCSVALAEAMALGTPVIGANVGGIPEVMGELGREWLPEPTDVERWADAVTQMIELPELVRLALGQRAKTIAARFTPRANVDAVQGLYDELLSSSS